VAVWSAGVNPQTSADFEKQNAAFLGSADKINKQIKLFSICEGDKDFALAGSNNLSELLNKRGIKNELHISAGTHTWAVATRVGLPVDRSYTATPLRVAPSRHAAWLAPYSVSPAGG